MRKKVLLSLLSVLLVLTSVPLLAYGADDNQTESVSIYLNGKQDKKGKGYDWDASEKTFTLNNVNLKNTAFHISAGSATIIVKGDKNHLYGVYFTKNCKQVIIRGTGTLHLGQSMVLAKNVFIEECSLDITKSIEGPAYADVRIRDNATVKCGKDFNTGMGSDLLTVEHASLECGMLRAKHARIIKGGEVRCGYIDQVSTLFADETATLYVCEEYREGIFKYYSSGIESEFGNYIHLLGQDMYIQGEKYALYDSNLSNSPLRLTLPEDAKSPSGAEYAVARIFGPTFLGSHTTIYEKGINDPFFDPEAYESDEYPLIGGSSTFIYQSPEVKEAKEKMGKIRLQAYSQAYAKTKKQKRKIKVWWEQLNEEKQQVSGYEIARSRKRDSGYGIMFSSPTERYINTASLTKGTRYYYKVRAYQQVNYTRYYSDWSNVTDKLAK